MIPTDPAHVIAWIEAITKGGAVGIVILFALGLVKGWWITAMHHSEVLSEKERHILACTEIHSRNEEDLDALLSVARQTQETQTRFLDLLRDRPCLLDGDGASRKRGSR